MRTHNICFRGEIRKNIPYTTLTESNDICKECRPGFSCTHGIYHFQDLNVTLNIQTAAL